MEIMNRRIKRWSRFSETLLLMLVFGVLGHASAITDLGTEYSLTNKGQLDAPGGVTDAYRILLKVNPTNYTGSHSDYIRIVAPKISSSVNDVVLVAAPGGTDLWTTYIGGANSKGFSGNGSGFFCS